MRRLALTALLATALLGAAACGTTAGETPTAATYSAAATTLLDKAAACAAYSQEMDGLKARTLTLMESVLKAESDPALAEKAAEDVKALFADIQEAVDRHLATAGDAQFKADLTAFSEQLKLRRAAIDAAGKDLVKVLAGLDDPAFTAAGDKMDTLCA